jgi:hypothetical protein
MRSVPWVVVACSVAWTFFGCAPVQPSLARDQAPDASAGYIGAVFQVEKGSDYGFVLVDAGGREYVLSFSRSSDVGGARHFSVVAVPPGDYKVAYWLNDTRVVTSENRREVKNAALSKPFPVKAGQVLFLGDFKAKTNVTHGYNVTYVHWSIQPQAITADAVVKQLREGYPRFAQVAVECILCTAPASGATEFAMPVSAPSGDFSPAHEIVLHYRRPSGNYSGWGLHVWEELPGKQQRLLMGVTWQSPLEPSGADDYGAYWTLNDTGFRNGRVPFIIHNGDIRDTQRVWSIGDAREVWVLDGDSTIYTSKEAALAK